MLDDTIPTRSLSECGVCSHGELETLIELPQFPLTGIYVTKKVPDMPNGHDQKLRFCPACGHAQLKYALDPTFLYGDHYLHRSSASHLTPAAVDFIADYLEVLRPGQRFKLAVEIGCNEMVLLDRVLKRSESAIGIDPLWRDTMPEEKPGRRVIGKFLEEVDLYSELGGRPDLIISTHNLEHIVDAGRQLTRLMEIASDDALFLMEVPDFDLMVKNLRFDQVFHQHVHYFGLTSFVEAIERAGGHYLTHVYNYRNWGGTVVVAFTKSTNSATRPARQPRTVAGIKQNFQLFRDQLAGTSKMLQGMSGEIWGYGAAQMLPTLAYHMETDFGFLAGILDDCPKRTGLTYPELDVLIHKPDEKTNLGDSVAVITALDAVRPIMNRLREFNPRFVVVPSKVY